MEDNEENLYMQVKIKDDTGEEMMALENVKLYYSLKGYTTPVNGLDADVEWNYSTGYYEGEFQSKPGEYGFLYVTVGDNVITTATTSPTFVITSPNPPSFNNGNTPAHQYAPNPTNAKIIVGMNDSEGITEESIIGIISNGTDTFEVHPEIVESSWQFAFPADAQGGTWTLEEIRIAGVYNNGSFSTPDNPYIIDLEGKSGVTTELITRINIEFTNKENDIGFSGAFLDEHTLTDALLGSLKISYNQGNALPISGNIKLIYSYGGDSKDKGGYTMGFAAPNTVEVLLKDDGTHKNFILDQSNLTVFKYAGTYTLTGIQFAFKFENGDSVTVNIPENQALPEAADIVVTSTAPSVKISAITPTGSVNAYVSHSRSGLFNRNVTIKTTPYTASKTDTTANVCYLSSKADYGLASYCNLTQPTVTISLSNIGNAKEATLSFGESALIYDSNAGTTTSPYTWTANGACKRYIGTFQSVWGGDDSRTVAGTITATVLTLKDSSGNTYTVDITDITINNPY